MGKGATGMSIEQYYEENPDFRRYVDAFAKDKNETVEQVLRYKIVIAKAEDIREHEMERR